MLIQYVTLKLLPEAESQLAKDMAKAASAGVDALEHELRVEQANIKKDMADGFLTPQEAGRLGKRAAEMYNKEITAKMEELAKAGKGASKEYVELGNRLKDVSTMGTQSAGLLTKAWGGFKTMVMGLAAPLTALLSVKAVVDFTTASVRGALQQEEAWNRLGASIRGNGENFARLEPLVRKSLGALGDKYLFDPDDLAQGMAKVNTATGDTSKSLRIMEASAALARKTGMDLTQATDLVTNAVVNNRTRGLEPWLGPLDKSQDLLGQIADRTKDAMENMTPMQQVQARMALAWDDLSDTLGRTILKFTDASGILPAITEHVKAMAEWVSENQETIIEWGTNIYRTLKVLVLPAWGELVAAFKLVQSAWYLLEAVFYKGLATFDDMKVAVLEFVRGVNGAVLSMVQTMEKAARFIGATDIADALHASAAKITADWNALSTQVTKATRSMDENQIKSNEARAKSWAKLNEGADRLMQGYLDAGDVVHEWATETEKDSARAADAVATNTTAMADAAGQNTKRMTKQELEEEAAREKERQKAAKKALAEREKEWAFERKRFEDSRKALVAAQAAQTTAVAQAAQIAFDSYVKAADAVVPKILAGQKDVADAWHAQREAIEAVDTALHDATRTYNRDLIPAIQRGSQTIDQAADDQIKAADGVTEAFRGGEQYYTNVAVPNILAGMQGLTEAQRQQAKSVAENSERAAEATEASWGDAINSLIGTLSGLGGILGGTFDAIANSAGRIVIGVNSIGAAIKQVGSASGGLMGTLQKVTGVLGGLGGAIGIVTSIGGLVGGAFKGSKDPGRIKGNEEAFQLGLTAQTPEELKTYIAWLLDKAPKRLGGGGNWATTAAQEDAAEKLISLLRRGAIKFHDEDSLVALRQIYGRLSTYGSEGTAGRTWAEAEMRAIPVGVPGFQFGGIMPHTGLAQLHRGELVVPEALTNQLLALAGARGTTSTSQSWDNRRLTVNQVFNGVQDRDIPRLAVDGIKSALAQDYRTATALEGNTRLPQ